MIVDERMVDPAEQAPEDDGTLRPQRLGEFLGQPRVVGQLSVYLEAARGRGEACDHVLLAGPAGPQVQYREVRGSPVTAVGEALESLITIGGLRPSDVAVLFADVARRDEIVRNGRIGGMEFANVDEPGHGLLVADSVRRFKGLEQQAVVLVQPSLYVQNDELLYVALSRARSLLVLVDDAAGLSALRKQLMVDGTQRG